MDYPVNYCEEVQNIEEGDCVQEEKELALKAFMREMFTHVTESRHSTEEAISKYMSKDYVQHVNGEVFDFENFVQHMKALKTALKSIKITIDRCMVSGNGIFMIYYADCVKNNGSPVKAKIIAYFEVKDGKIILCDELTKILVGEKEDQDLGSRR